MSIHFPPSAFTVPAGVIVGAILSHERTRIPRPVTLAPGWDFDVIDITPDDWRDITPPQCKGA